jgi:hypothetical protein
MPSNSYYGNPHLKITQYQHPSLGIISQNKNPQEHGLISSAHSSNPFGTSNSSTIANGRRQSRDTPLLDDVNDLIHTQASDNYL